MAQGVVLLFDDQSDARVRSMWASLGEAGLTPVTRYPPHLTLAMAGDIPRRARDAVRADLRHLAVPSVWFASLGTFASTENVLMLSAVVDAELLAVHSAVHDVLAGAVRNPSAYYLPGNWAPHCTLMSQVPDDDLVAGFRTLFPVSPLTVRAKSLAVLDTSSDEVDVLVHL